MTRTKTECQRVSLPHIALQPLSLLQRRGARGGTRLNFLISIPWRRPPCTTVPAAATTPYLVQQRRQHELSALARVHELEKQALHRTHARRLRPQLHISRDGRQRPNLHAGAVCIWYRPIRV